MTSIINNVANSILHINTSFGILLFFIIYILSVIFLLPASWLSLISGFIYGPFYGSLIVFCSAFCGATLSFFIAQYFLSELIINKISQYKVYPLLKEILKKGGLKLFILTRLSPLFPFGILNYFYGLNKINFRDFSISLLFILPGTYLYCSLGNLASELSDIKNISNKNSIFAALSFLATAFVFYFIIRYSNQFFKESNKL